MFQLKLPTFFLNIIYTENLCLREELNCVSKSHVSIKGYTKEMEIHYNSLAEVILRVCCLVKPQNCVHFQYAHHRYFLDIAHTHVVMKKKTSKSFLANDCKSFHILNES